MKEPNLKDYNLTERIIDWFPDPPDEFRGTPNLPRKFYLNGKLFIIGACLFLYFTWEIGGLANKIDDFFVNRDLTALILLSPFLSMFIVFSLIPKFIKTLVFLFLRKHKENVTKYDEEIKKYEHYKEKENIKNRKSHLLTKLKEIGFEFPLFDESKYYSQFRKVFIKGFTEIQKLDNYHLKKFRHTVPSKIFKDLSKYRYKDIQNCFITLIGLSHLMKWEGFRDIIYSLGIVLPYYDNHRTQSVKSDYRKLELEKLKNSLEEEINSKKYLYHLEIPEKLKSEFFLDLRFIEMTKLITYLDLLTEDKEIFKIEKFREKFFKMLPLKTSTYLIKLSWNKSYSSSSELYDPELVNYYAKVIKQF